MKQLEQQSLIPYLKQEFGEEEKTVFLEPKTSAFVVVPTQSAQELFRGSKLDLQRLDQFPEPAQMDNYEGVFVVESQSGTGDPFKTRAQWYAQSPAAAVGALFPTLRPFVREYETLAGILFHNQQTYQGSISEELIGPWLKALNQSHVHCLTNVLTLQEQRDQLEYVLSESTPRNVSTIAIYGLGDIGSHVAQSLYTSKNRDQLKKLILGSKSQNTVEALRLEFEDMELPGRTHPEILTVTQKNIHDIFQADLILFLASGYIPPADSHSLGIDVRAIQYAVNVQILREFLERAQEVSWNGMLLVGSDPVEQLTMAAFQSIFPYSRNNQRVAGFGAAINYGRARHQAEEMGYDKEVIAIYGAHGKSVVAIPHQFPFSIEDAETLSLRTGLRNYRVREQGKKPWRAPAQLMAQAIHDVMDGRTTWASIFLPGNTREDFGAYFGVPVEANVKMNLWTPSLLRSNWLPHPYIPEVKNILAREHRWIAETSLNPGLLHTDPFDGASNPEKSRHFAFHPDLYGQWHQRATRNLELMNQPYIARAAFATTIESDIHRAITFGDIVAEEEAKRALSEFIHMSVQRDAVVKEKLDLFHIGANGGELFSNAHMSDIPRLAAEMAKGIDREEKTQGLLQTLSNRREPEIALFPSSELLARLQIPVHFPDGKVAHTLGHVSHYLQELSQLKDFPLELLKYPNLAVRTLGWEMLNTFLMQNSSIDPIYWKKILTLCHFGDDFTLYQISPDQEENARMVDRFIQTEQSVLKYFASQTASFPAHWNTNHAVVLGTTGAPLGRHHIEVLQAGIAALHHRYPRDRSEGFLSLDNFSRSKVPLLTSGEIPSLALRRRIALLQTVNDPLTHVLLPAIPIWFDVANKDLMSQIKQELPPQTKIWRLIGGDSLTRYPQTPLYQHIPHIVDMRGQNRREMDTALNRLHFSEYVQIDSNHPGSSTAIRKDLAGGIAPQGVTPLTWAFMRHYNVFTKGVVFSDSQKE